MGDQGIKFRFLPGTIVLLFFTKALPALRPKKKPPIQCVTEAISPVARGLRVKLKLIASNVNIMDKPQTFPAATVLWLLSYSKWNVITKKYIVCK